MGKQAASQSVKPPPLYSAEQRRRRDASPWTPVQGVLAALQFLAFAVSVVLVLRFLLTDLGYTAATWSVVVKTGLLYAIMITGALWERDVYGQLLFAPAFFWEDVVSMGVILLHSLYLAVWLLELGAPREQMLVALAAYVAYVVNAGQFLYKFRRARSDARHGETGSSRGAAASADAWVEAAS